MWATCPPPHRFLGETQSRGVRAPRLHRINGLSLMKNQSQEPLLKRVMDNPWLLLALGVLVPMLSYTLWGWIELHNVTAATLP